MPAHRGCGGESEDRQPARRGQQTCFLPALEVKPEEALSDDRREHQSERNRSTALRTGQCASTAGAATAPRYLSRTETLPTSAQPAASNRPAITRSLLPDRLCGQTGALR